MKPNKRFSRLVIAALLSISVTGLPAGITAFAAQQPSFTYTSVSGGSAVFEKYLTMDSYAHVPNVTFNYTIEPGAQLDSDGQTTLKVFAGNDTNAVEGTPTISSARFSPEDTTYDYIQTQPESVTVQNEDTAGTKNEDKLTLDEGKKYARHDVTVDFSNVLFKEPGVYRYVITESASTANGITNDADATRVLDVYVINAGEDNKQLQVEGYVLQNAEADGTVLRDGTGTTEKSKGYTNDYTTHNLTVSKSVSGNQASHDEYFKFTVRITNATPGTVYSVLGKFQNNTSTNAINTESHYNPGELTVGSDGTVTQDYWLQDGQNITIYGLADKTAYSVKEDKDTLDKESYVPSATVTGDTTTGSANTAIALSNTDYSVSDDAITADTTVAYTNTKFGTIPTGIIMSVLPGALVCIAGVAGVVIITMNKRRRNAE